MEISTAALPFLILAAVLGPPTQAALKPRSPDSEIRMETDEKNNSIIMHAVMRGPGGCCLSYSLASIPCNLMVDYFPRISGCLLPAVIFKTKNKIGVCAFPGNTSVKECMEKLDLIKKQGKVSVEETLP